MAVNTLPLPATTPISAFRFGIYTPTISLIKHPQLNIFLNMLKEVNILRKMLNQINNHNWKKKILITEYNTFDGKM